MDKNTIFLNTCVINSVYVIINFQYYITLFCMQIRFRFYTNL